MKKTLFVAVFIACACICSAQNLKNKAIMENPEISTLREHAPNDYLNAVSTKAVRNFKKTFKDVADERWFTTTEGCRVNFVENGIRCRSDYDKRGHWLHTIRYNTAEKLPTDVTRLVVDNYPNHHIILVEEIDVPGRVLIRVIHLEGPTDWVNIKVSDDEIYELQTIKKL